MVKRGARDAEMRLYSPLAGGGAGAEAGVSQQCGCGFHAREALHGGNVRQLDWRERGLVCGRASDCGGSWWW